MMFGSDGGAGPVEHPGGAASASEDRQQQTPVPFSERCKPIQCSVRIVSMQDSNAATAATCASAGGAGGREPGTDWTKTTRPSPFFILPFLPFFLFLLLPCVVPFCDQRTLANPFFFPDTRCPLACRYRDTAKVPIPGLHFLKQDEGHKIWIYMYVLRIHLLHPTSYVFEKRSPERLFIPTIEKETRRTMWWGIYLYTGESEYFLPVLIVAKLGKHHIINLCFLFFSDIRCRSLSLGGPSSGVVQLCWVQQRQSNEDTGRVWKGIQPHH
jgi:hypothetical protein